MGEQLITEVESDLTPQEIRKRAVRSAGALFSLLVFIRLITRIRTLLVIPFLDASDFGLNSLAISIYAVVTMLILGYDISVITEKKDIDQMYSVHTAFNFVYITTIGLVVILFRHSLANLFDAPLLSMILLVKMSANIFFSLGAGAKVKLRREIRQNIISIVEVIANGLIFLVTVFLAYSGYGIWSLIFGTITGKTFATISYLAIVKTPSKRFDRAHIIRYFKGGANYNVLKILAVNLSNMATLLVGFVSGVSNLGYYSLAFGIALLLTDMIVNPITAVTLPAYARMDSKTLGIGFQRTLEFISISLFGMSLIGIFSIKFLITFFYGEKWLPVANLAQVTLVLTVAVAILRIFDNYLFFQREIKFLIRVRLFQIGILFGLGIPLTYYFGPIGMIVGQLLHISVALFFEGKVVSKQFRVNLISDALQPASTAGLLTLGIVSMGLFLFNTNSMENVILIVIFYGIGIAITGRKVVVALSKLVKHAYFPSKK